MENMKYNLDTLMHIRQVGMLNIKGYEELVGMLQRALLDAQCKIIELENVVVYK